MRQRRLADGSTVRERRNRPAADSSRRQTRNDSAGIRPPHDLSQASTSTGSGFRTTIEELGDTRQCEFRGDADVHRYVSAARADGKTTLAFDTDKLKLSEARMRVGKSDLTLTGELNGMRQAFLRNGILKGNLSLVSDYLDCNQIMRAINRSSLLVETDTDTATDEEAIIAQWEEKEQLAENTEENIRKKNYLSYPKTWIWYCTPVSVKRTLTM